MKLVENLTYFSNNTSIHGLVYIAKKSSTKVKRITWFIIFLLSMIYAGTQIGKEVKSWSEVPTITIVDTLAYSIEDVSFPSVTICPQTLNSDRWGSTIKILDYFQWQCSIKGECNRNQIMFKEFSAKVDKASYQAAVTMIMALYSSCDNILAWNFSNAERYKNCTYQISGSNFVIQRKIGIIESYSSNQDPNLSIQAQFEEALDDIELDPRIKLEQVLNYIESQSFIQLDSKPCFQKYCLEDTREVIVRLKMIEWGIFGPGIVSTGLYIVENSLMLGSYFGDIGKSNWPHIPLHRKQTILEEDINELLTNITFNMSNGTLENVSILDLPAFGSTVGTLRRDLKKHFNWPIETNHAILTKNGNLNLTIVFSAYKTLVENWGYHMENLEKNDNITHFTFEMKNNKHFNFTRFIKADMKTFLIAISGSFLTTYEQALPIWYETAKATFNQTKDDNFVKQKGVYDKLIIDCAFRENLRRKKQPSEHGGCQYFELSLTTNGMCYTFNGKHSSELWRMSEVTTEFGNLLPSKAKNLKTFGGSRTTQGLQFWVNMKPYSNQPFGPSYIPYTLGVSEQNTFIDQKTSLQKLRPGYHTTIHVIPKILETTTDFDNLELHVRGCKLPQETTGFQLLKEYSRKGCELECAVRKATGFCKCLPWHYPNNFTLYPMCDMFGGHCFNQIMSTSIYYKICRIECLEDCHYTSLSMWHSTIPLEAKKICTEDTYFDKFFKQNLQRLFAFENYRMLVQKQSTLDLTTSLRNGSLCTTYINKYVSFVSIESPTKSITKSHRDQRKFFIDKLGTVGGTLGVCAGMSVLSMVEVVVFVYIVLMGIVLDLRHIWKKIRPHFWKIHSGNNKKLTPPNQVTKFYCNEIEEDQEKIQTIFLMNLTIMENQFFQPRKEKTKQKFVEDSKKIDLNEQAIRDLYTMVVNLSNSIASSLNYGESTKKCKTKETLDAQKTNIYVGMVQLDLLNIAFDKMAHKECKDNNLTLISTKKATYHDLEAGAKSKSNENEISIGKKCSRFLVKTTLTCFILAVFIAYFMAISRHSNLIGNLQEFDVAMVTKSPLIESLESTQSSKTTTATEHICVQFGGVLEWIADGFCDDMNNNAACSHDGGDCCGTLANKEFCLDCLCIKFTCSVDADCNQGYCEDNECFCLNGNQYKEDCSFGGYSKFLIINRVPKGISSEIIDMSELRRYKCSSWVDTPLAIDPHIGGLLGIYPIVCGQSNERFGPDSYITGCYKIGNKEAKFIGKFSRIKTFGAASLVINKTSLWITGGHLWNVELKEYEKLFLK